MCFSDDRRTVSIVVGEGPDALIKDVAIPPEFGQSRIVSIFLTWLDLNVQHALADSRRQAPR